MMSITMTRRKMSIVDGGYNAVHSIDDIFSIPTSSIRVGIIGYL
jgi:hypothetical protein